MVRSVSGLDLHYGETPQGAHISGMCVGSQLPWLLRCWE